MFWLLGQQCEYESLQIKMTATKADDDNGSELRLSSLLQSVQCLEVEGLSSPGTTMPGPNECLEKAKHGRDCFLQPVKLIVLVQ